MDDPAGIVVVKCGGGGGIDPVRLSADVARLVEADTPLVLVHGGSAEMARIAAGLGVGLRQLVAPDGVVTRYTDEATLDVLTLALAGRVKPALVSELARHGVSAIGLTGLDASLLRARRKTAVRTVVDGRTVVVRDDLSGRIVSVNTTLLRMLLTAGLLPVLSPPALAEDGRPVNVNADRAAAAVAVALQARSLLFMTAAPGVLRDPGDSATALRRYRLPRPGATPDPWINGGMRIKLVAAGEALAGGVHNVRVTDGHVDCPVSRALRGETGTVITLHRPVTGDTGC